MSVDKKRKTRMMTLKETKSQGGDTKKGRRERPADAQSPTEEGTDLPSGWELLEREDVHGGTSEDDHLGEGDVKKKTKHQKKSEKKRKEERIRDVEARRKAGYIAPRTGSEFEQMVMSSPNSSYVWIQYMAYLIAQGETERARATAQRAIATISFREQDEKFNVWIAWINAENTYGTEESTEDVFRKAMAQSSQSKILKTVLDVYELTGKLERAHEIAGMLCKYFSDNPESWIRCIRFYLQQGDAEQAKVCYGKSLQALPKRHHVHTSLQAALLEFKFGDPERGRSMMERILQDNPRRNDIWNVYLDQEMKHGEEGRVKALYERCTHLTWPSKKMKAIFKKYLEYAKRIGDEDLVDHVKARAMEYVQRLQNSSMAEDE
jgi:rRNA biogenesis protein RRP5